MSGRDPHQALRTATVSQAQSKNIKLLLARLQWSKTEVGYSLHASPHTFSLSGFQATDFLNLLGFQRSACAFVDRNECYVRWVNQDFDVNRFAEHFDQGYADLLEAQRHLEACGFLFDQPEGWAYFFGASAHRTRRDGGMAGDGHTAMKTSQMKQSEDETFAYQFTWLETAHGKGWVTHYRPKHPPLSSELQGIFTFLGLREFQECPQFEFESCNWRSQAFVEHGDGFFDSNAEFAHRCFDAHATNFSLGIEKLLAANAAVEHFGLGFLSLSLPPARLDADIERRVTRPAPRGSKPATSQFDVALSFAGTEREHAERLATMLREAGYSVFYDDFYPEYLWGKNLVDTFDEIYRKRARYCVMFISREYKERAWTNHERQSAQARALTDKGTEYILPIKVDETELLGMPPTVGYVSLSKGIQAIGELLIAKLKP